MKIQLLVQHMGLWISRPLNWWHQVLQSSIRREYGRDDCFFSAEQITPQTDSKQQIFHCISEFSGTGLRQRLPEHVRSAGCWLGPQGSLRGTQLVDGSDHPEPLPPCVPWWGPAGRLGSARFLSSTWSQSLYQWSLQLDSQTSQVMAKSMDSQT